MSFKPHTQASFSKDIENMVIVKKISYWDAVCLYCETHKMEPETIPRLLTPQIKSKLEIELTDLNLINRGKKKLKGLE